ncbi:MAG: hypothetical protein CMI08_19120 [Oceanospirillaceae bacterium]|nr:hypothetical protein [Thalassolituus sp.]MAS25926.1 hypothetical protein [Oceanospirillaceae bacterium]MAY01276.1 hypothetical protein [Oceanospirillaceae bacterium]MBL35540.1 hypothetical protein [Oceanospirillaceae bacterium]MBS53226.1 hypothetical protein [Oceanospirillaceae bacterium]
MLSFSCNKTFIKCAANSSSELDAMNFRAHILPFILSLFSVAVHAAPAPFSDDLGDGDNRILTIHGSNTIGAELAPNLAKAWLQAKGAEDIRTSATGVENEMLITGQVGTRSQVSVKVAAHGSGTGFTGLKSGDADIAAASRPAKDKEVALLQGMADMRSPASEHIVGIDGLAIIVNPNNPVADLSVEQIAQIFSGGYTDWAEVGGMSGPIHVYARDDKSGTWDSFKGMVLGKHFKLIDSAKRYESNAELSDAVSSDVGGIGFVGLSSVRQSKLLSVSDGAAKSLMPNKLTVATEDYALSRRLYMYTDDTPANPYVGEFIQFVTENQGQQIVADTGFISQEVKAVMPESYAELPADFREITADAQRLTINFRFYEGSAKLDNKALRDLDRLVHYVQEHPQSELVLVGFGDNKKDEARSDLLSKLRAMAVRRELVRKGIYPEASLGYGANMPVASLTGNDGKTKNRRVEVWVRHASAAAGSVISGADVADSGL